MTEKEVEQNMKKIIAITAPGLACGYKHVQIIDYDFTKRTMWGKGIVIYRNLYDNGTKQVSACLTQVDIYTGEVVRKIRRTKNTNKKEETQAETVVKKSRQKKSRRRRNV